MSLDAWNSRKVVSIPLDAIVAQVSNVGWGMDGTP
jgi:hypothetical protein